MGVGGGIRRQAGDVRVAARAVVLPEAALVRARRARGQQDVEVVIIVNIDEGRAIVANSSIVETFEPEDPELWAEAKAKFQMIDKSAS